MQNNDLTAALAPMTFHLKFTLNHFVVRIPESSHYTEFDFKPGTTLTSKNLPLSVNTDTPNGQHPFFVRKTIPHGTITASLPSSKYTFAPPLANWLKATPTIITTSLGVFQAFTSHTFSPPTDLPI